MISNDEDLMIHPDATFIPIPSAGKVTFDYVIVLNGGIVDASAYQGTKVTSSKEAEMRAVPSHIGKG